MPDECQAHPAHGIVAGVGQRSSLGRTRLLAAKRGTIDMEPTLVKAPGGSPSEPLVELHVWMAVTKRWKLVGSMATPSTDFTWAIPDGAGGGKLVRNGVYPHTAHTAPLPPFAHSPTPTPIDAGARAPVPF